MWVRAGMTWEVRNDAGGRGDEREARQVGLRCGGQLAAVEETETRSRLLL